MFGLDHTSGVEIPENDPQISSEDPERSAMGQGTHSYTNVQLSRYVAALANRGTVFELSLLDKLTDSDGNLITDYSPEASSHIEAADTTWNAVQTGMRRVITDSSAKKIFQTCRWKWRARLVRHRRTGTVPTMPFSYPLRLTAIRRLPLP